MIQSKRIRYEPNLKLPFTFNFNFCKYIFTSDQRWCTNDTALTAVLK